MSQLAGPGYNDSGLVFIYDENDRNSYRGEPTTNIAYATNNYLNSSSNWWENGGSTIFSDNDTSIPKPIIPNVDTSNLRIFSSTVTGAGSNQQLGSSIISISPSTQYTMSIYFWFQGSTLQVAPYLRTAVNNNSLGSFAYNGDTNYLNWPRGKWIRLSVTFTTQSNETGVYMSSYTGDYVGEKLAYFGYQLEQKDHMTPLVLGTRSVTQSLMDVTGNSTIDLTNGGYDSNGELYFDGTNDYATISGGYLGSLTGDTTLVGWFYHNGTTAAPHRTIICTDTNYRAGLKLMSYYHGSLGAWVANSNGTGDYMLNGRATPTNSWNMLACTRDVSGRLMLYLNGVLENSAYTGLVGPTYVTGNPLIGGEYHSKYLGKLPYSMAYNRVLSATEILDIYNKTRTKSF